jgi:NADH-quinone oxidoreductase subunit C
MSKLTPDVLERQDKVTSRLQETFPTHRLERDKNAEPILWLSSINEVLPLVKKLQREFGVDRVSDITAYDNKDKKDGPKRFVMVYQLYAMKDHTRIRLKANLDESEAVPSLTTFFAAANWLEREVFDMYGLTFSNHPDLRRILMDERFVGHPLRKDYDMKERQPFSDSLPVRIIDRAPVLPASEVKS